VRRATVDEALNSPHVPDGRKITVAARRLANRPLRGDRGALSCSAHIRPGRAVVHRSPSFISFVEFADGSVLAQPRFPNMELPILYA